MKILYIGDIMGEMGIKSIEKFLPEIVKTNKVDFVVAQAENVTDGKGISLLDYLKLKKIGIDAFTGGNWSLSKETIIPSLNNPEEPIVRPANYPSGTEGLGYKLITKDNKKILIISLLGQIVGRDSKRSMDNPLITADNIIEKYEAENPIIVVNFHGDFSSEKKVIGYYLDGRASLVVGDHWHIPTADAMVLPKGTAHITDVGMCGSLDSSLGVKLESIINRWKENTQTMNILEDSGRIQFNAVLADIDEKTHKATNIEQIQKIV